MKKDRAREAEAYSWSENFIGDIDNSKQSFNFSEITVPKKS